MFFIEIGDLLCLGANHHLVLVNLIDIACDHVENFIVDQQVVHGLLALHRIKYILVVSRELRQFVLDQVLVILKKRVRDILQLPIGGIGLVDLRLNCAAVVVNDLLLLLAAAEIVHDLFEEFLVFDLPRVHAHELVQFLLLLVHHFFLVLERSFELDVDLLALKQFLTDF